jgi:hypothetical protein
MWLYFRPRASWYKGLHTGLTEGWALSRVKVLQPLFRSLESLLLAANLDLMQRLCSCHWTRHNSRFTDRSTACDTRRCGLSVPWTWELIKGPVSTQTGPHVRPLVCLSHVRYLQWKLQDELYVGPSSITPPLHEAGIALHRNSWKW